MLEIEYPTPKGLDFDQRFRFLGLRCSGAGAGAVSGVVLDREAIPNGPNSYLAVVFSGFKSGEAGGTEFRLKANELEWLLTAGSCKWSYTVPQTLPPRSNGLFDI